MLPPVYFVCPVSAHDAPGIAETIVRAFYEDPHWKGLWPSTMTIQEIIDSQSARLPKELTNDRSVYRHLKVLDTTTRTVVGYSRYKLPASHLDLWPLAQIAEPSDEEKAAFRQSWEGASTNNGRPKGINCAIIDEFYTTTVDAIEKKEEVFGDRAGDMMLVDFFAVHPDHQRKKVGSSMLAKAIAIADKSGLMIGVKSTPAAVKFYEEHEFVLKQLFSSQDASKYGFTEPLEHYWLIRGGFSEW